MPILLRQFRAQASPVALAPGELGALTQPRSPTRETYELETALAPQGGTIANVDENVTISFRSPDLRATAFMGLFCLGMILLGVWNDFPPFWHFPILIGLIFFVISVTTYLETGRGKFRLDKGGILQISWLKKPRYLGWQDVDQVKWFPNTCCLQGKGTRISINWTMANSASAKAFVERVLSPQFDLSIKPVRQWSYEPNVRSFLLWLSKVIGFSIAGTTLFIVPFAGLILLHASRWTQVGWFGLFYLGIILYLASGGREYRRRQELINPTWRLRRNEERPG